MIPNVGRPGSYQPRAPCGKSADPSVKKEKE